MLKLLKLLGLSLPVLSWGAGLTQINVSLNQTIEAPRWMYEPNLKVKGPPLILHMVEAKKALLGKDRVRCLAALQKAFAVGKSLGPWLALNQLQCAVIKDNRGHYSLESLQQALARLEVQPKWMLIGPSAIPLRQAYTNALLAVAEEQLKSDRRSAWATLDKLQQVRPWLSSEDKANTYRWAGELAFIEQNLSAATDFLVRSLSEKESADVRARVESIRSSLLAGKKRDSVAIPTKSKGPNNGAPEDLEMTDQERDIYKRMTRAYDSQDYLSAIEDGVELLRKFPGSRRASEASDRVLEIYMNLAGRTEDKYRHVRESAVKEMQKVDAGRMARWANNAYAKGNYLDAQTLAEKAYTKYEGHPDSTKVLLLAGKAAYAAGEYDEARHNFEKILQQHNGTPESAEATFRLGLLELRLKHYSPASARFERLLALSQGKDFENRALYWQWRAQQKLDPTKSNGPAEALIAKFPLTYYGLRARAELNGGELQLTGKPLTIRSEMRLMESERLAWERFNLLLKAGWLKEAERELDSLPEPQSSEERLLRAKLWSATFRYDNAINLASKAFDQSPELVQASTLKIVFPLEYASFINRESKSAGINANWIRALIRQESSFRPELKSPANALGVMQLLPGTGAEIATDLHVKNFSPDALLNPETNIKLGCAYFSRLVRSFSGNVPLSLAAYNAGPTRLRRWLNARKDLSPLDATANLSPETEIWMDELPWEETSYYVKSILRNWLIYQLLETSKVSVSQPIWMDVKDAAR